MTLKSRSDENLCIRLVHCDITNLMTSPDWRHAYIMTLPLTLSLVYLMFTPATLRPSCACCNVIYRHPLVSRGGVSLLLYKRTSPSTCKCFVYLHCRKHTHSKLRSHIEYIHLFKSVDIVVAFCSYCGLLYIDCIQPYRLIAIARISCLRNSESILFFNLLTCFFL